MYKARITSRALQNYLCWNIESDRIICLNINIYQNVQLRLTTVSNPFIRIIQGFREAGERLHRELIDLNLKILRRVPVRARMVF